MNDEVTKIIFRIINIHINDVDICENGFIVLLNIITDNGEYNHTFLQRKNIVIADNFGAVEMIVKALEIHINNYNVCNIGSKILWNIVTSQGKELPFYSINPYFY